MWLSTFLPIAGSSVHEALTGVIVAPCATAFTRMPRSEYSNASVRVVANTAPKCALHASDHRLASRKLREWPSQFTCKFRCVNDCCFHAESVSEFQTPFVAKHVRAYNEQLPRIDTSTQSSLSKTGLDRFSWFDLVSDRESFRRRLEER